MRIEIEIKEGTKKLLLERCQVIKEPHDSLRLDAIAIPTISVFKMLALYIVRNLHNPSTGEFITMLRYCADCLEHPNGDLT